jgi:hypothetical protein
MQSHKKLKVNALKQNQKCTLHEVEHDINIYCLKCEKFMCEKCYEKDHHQHGRERADEVLHDQGVELLNKKVEQLDTQVTKLRDAETKVKENVEKLGKVCRLPHKLTI